jgi:hypothetical protein
MRRKGNLLPEESVGVVIAVLCIVFLLIGGLEVYGYVKNQDTENAKTAINYFDDQIKALEIGNTGRFTIKAIPGWFIIGWSKDNPYRPDKCSLGSCLCICYKAGSESGDIETFFKTFTPESIYSNWDNTLVTSISLLRTEKILNKLAENCQNKGVCRVIEADKIVEANLRPGVYARIAEWQAGPIIDFGSKSNLAEFFVSKERDPNKNIILKFGSVL